jgi:5-methylthioadenosine/S-adenosylhomocysteine deaminase
MPYLIIRGGTIVTMNPRGDILQDCSVVIEGNKIVDVGTRRDIDKKYLANETINAKGMVILPGLVNAHMHTVQSLFRGVADDVSLFEYLGNFILPLEESMNKEDVYISSLLGYAEMIKSGITTCADLQSVHYVDEAMKAAQEIGIRAKIAKTLMDSGDFPEGLIESPEEAIKDSVRILHAWHGKENGRIQFALAPRFIHSCSIELMKEVRHLANKYALSIYTHAAENKTEAKEVKEKYKKTTIELLQEVGLTGSDVLLAHCIWLSEKEFKILKETNSNVVHCPSCNMKLASGICNVNRLIKYGVTVALGSDGTPCNNTSDIFREARLAALLGKVSYLNPKVLPANIMLKMATLNGAKALKLDSEIGSIEKGKKADLILVNFKKLHLAPMYDVVSHLIYCCQGSDVDTVIIDGRVVMKNRRLKFVEEDSLRLKAQYHAENLFARVKPQRKRGQN